MPDPLPHGFNKTWANGYGFTRILSPLIYFLQDNFPKIKEIVVSSQYNTKIEKKKITLNSEDIEGAYRKLDPLIQQHKGEIRLSANDIFSEWFPAEVEKQTKNYDPGHLERIIREHEVTGESLTTEDRESILDLISTFSDEATEVRKRQISFAKEKIDQVYIETILEEFETLINLTTDSSNLEEKWHQFFRENSWIFSQLFAFPMVLLKDKAYVGGKSVLDGGGKIADFLYTNEFSKNVAIIEIKTHLTGLMYKRPYRGSDVFSVSTGLSGAINQALDQRDNLQKEFYTLKKGEDFQSFNSKCVVLAGRVADLSEDQLKSFELFRNEVKDVEIVTFDELLLKIEKLIEIFKA